MKRTNGKLWRTTGYRLLSGRLHGQGRHRIDTKIPSPLLMSLIATTMEVEQEIKPFVSNPLNAVQPITFRG
jgi:hypothetical protein